MGMDESRDNMERRCPRLGGPVTFRYCRLSGDSRLPCWKVFDCWWETFDVESFVRANYSEDEVRQILSPPKPKMLSLVELIQQAQKAGEKSKE